MTLNCIHTVFHIFIVTGGLFVLVCHDAVSLRFYIHSCIYIRLLITSCQGTILFCADVVKQSINSADFIQVADVQLDVIDASLLILNQWSHCLAITSPSAIVHFRSIALHCGMIFPMNSLLSASFCCQLLVVLLDTCCHW